MSLKRTGFDLLTGGIYAGAPIIVRFNYVVENTYWHNFMPWSVYIELKLNGKVGNHYDSCLGRFGHRDNAEIQVTGVMPSHDLSGQFIFYAMGAFHVKPEEIDRLNIVIPSWHPGPPQPVYPCPYCPAEFASQAELDAHIRDVHDIEPPIVPPPPPEYECPYCDMAFYTQAELDDHIERWHAVVPPPDDGEIPPPDDDEKPPPTDIPWETIAILGAAGAAIYLITREPKKAKRK